MAAPPESLEVREVRDRVIKQYLPAWCASPDRPVPLDPAGFKPPDWSFLTPGLAHWFLTAIDEGVVQVTSDSVFMRGSSHSEGIFEHGLMATSPRQSKLRVESFFEIAAVGMLAVRFGWPVERLRFQSPDGAFDLLAYVDDDWDRSEVAIAGEAKQLQREAVKLSASLKVCGNAASTLKLTAPSSRTITGNISGSSSIDRASSGSSDLKRSPPLIRISSFEPRRTAAASSVCIA